MLKDDALWRAIATDWESAPLDPRRRAIADYAAKLTRAPAEMNRDDLEGLKAHGLSDTDCLQLVELIGYYAYVNRIADALGVQLEDDPAFEDRPDL